MTRFAHAHAAHADAREAFADAAARLDAQAASFEPTLGWLYLTDHFAQHADALLALAHERWPAVAWVGAVGVGICASGVEYFDEPALALMLSDLPRDRFRLFSGTAPLPRDDSFAAHTALVHADPATPELAELIGEMSERTATGYLFGGLASARTRTLTIADGVLEGGLSGVAFAAGVGIVSRVTQGCQPVGPARRIDEIDGNVVVSLDGRPALDALLEDLGIAELSAREALPRLRGTLVGLADAASDAGVRGAAIGGGYAGAFGADVRVRHLIGLDPARRAVAIADEPDAGTLLSFCCRDSEAAKRDLTRICAEVREAFEPAEATTGEASPQIAGAVYVSCAGRGGPHFGAPSAELAIVRRALGDVPLVGFFAAGEIGRCHLYGYTGVLTAFAQR
jgi:small ligand-binding sensory domain FIST